jgi:cytochrome c biogenesis protein CcdA
LGAEVPFGVALAAGVLAAVNPCGFALLPAYVSLLIVGDAGTPLRPVAALGRALALTAAMTAGFVAVFGVFGLLAAPAADWLTQRLPWLTIVIGIVLVGLGAWMAAGRQITSPVPKLSRAPELRGSFGSMFVFGVSFAIASLGCTIGPFLGVVVASFTSRSPAAGIGLFLAYAAGMALVVGAVAVAVALAQQTVVGRLRRAAPILGRSAGALMIAAGAYVAWYGWYELRILADPTTTDIVIDTAARLQTWLSSTVDRVGPAGLAIVLLATAAATAAVVARRRRHERFGADRSQSDDRVGEALRPADRRAEP